MRRGEIWTGGAKDYARKPRPVVIIQDNSFGKLDSVTICLFTTNPVDASLVRPVVEPSIGNGLRSVCRLIVDKIMTVQKLRIGVRIRRLADEDMARLNRAVLVSLGIAAPKG
jgi:mRNA interferase MazF